MAIRFIALALAATFASTGLSQVPQQPTANWGTMPNGWVNHGGQRVNRNAAVDNNRSGSPQRYPSNFYGPGYVYPGFGYQGAYGWGGYNVGYRCPICLNPYCVNPYCRGPFVGSPFVGGTIVSGLSLQVIGPQIIAGNGVLNPVAPAPILGGGGLPWQARLQQEQQAKAFDARNAAAARQRNANFLAAGEAADADADGIDPTVDIRRHVAALKPSSEAGRERSDRLISQADTFFAEQQFPQAARHYRQALAQGPNYPKPLFRLGHFFVATQEFDSALKAYLMALEISRDTQQPDFKLDDLYQGNALDKLTHLNRLAEEALAKPDDGGLLMLVGLTLYYDQQAERSIDFFRRASEMDGPQSVYARWYLRALGQPVRGK